MWNMKSIIPIKSVPSTLQFSITGLSEQNSIPITTWPVSASLHYIVCEKKIANLQWIQAVRYTENPQLWQVPFLLLHVLTLCRISCCSSNDWTSTLCHRIGKNDCHIQLSPDDYLQEKLAWPISLLGSPARNMTIFWPRWLFTGKISRVD